MHISCTLQRTASDRRGNNLKGFKKCYLKAKARVGFDCLIEREFVIDSLLFRIYLTIEMIWWIGLAPQEFEFNFPVSRVSTFLFLLLSYSTASG